MKHTAFLFAAAVVFAGTASAAAPNIPHPIDSYPPITAEQNACTMCHQLATSEQRVKPQIPVSHADGGKLAQMRNNCVMCHQVKK